ASIQAFIRTRTARRAVRVRALR
ncbi:hypothetical protein TSOC_014214, partial [Tetrabaena socialis]